MTQIEPFLQRGTWFIGEGSPEALAVYPTADLLEAYGLPVGDADVLLPENMVLVDLSRLAFEGLEDPTLAVPPSDAALVYEETLEEWQLVAPHGPYVVQFDPNAVVPAEVLSSLGVEMSATGLGAIAMVGAGGELTFVGCNGSSVSQLLREGLGGDERPSIESLRSAVDSGVPTSTVAAEGESSRRRSALEARRTA